MVINMKKTNKNNKVTKVWVVISAVVFVLSLFGVIFEFAKTGMWDSHGCTTLTVCSAVFVIELEMYQNNKKALDAE